MKGPGGYGRYNDDVDHVGCPRAASDMTPCIARDGAGALADDARCVGCYAGPRGLLHALRAELGRRGGVVRDPALAANLLRAAVRDATAPPEVRGE